MRKQIDISLKYLSSESNAAELSWAVIIDGNCLHRLHSFSYANRARVNTRPNTSVHGPIPGYSEMQDTSTLSDSITPWTELKEQGWGKHPSEIPHSECTQDIGQVAFTQNVFFPTSLKPTFLPQLFRIYGRKLKTSVFNYSYGKIL